MSSLYGEKLKITVFGQSHSKGIGVVIDGFPAGVQIDTETLKTFMARRAPGRIYTTPRKESDKVEFLSGLNEKGLTCGAPITAFIENTNQNSSDYDNVKICPRPSHSDLVSLLKHGDGADIRGGGQFSGRLTAPICVAGGIAKQVLSGLGVTIGAHIYKIGSVIDDEYSKTDEEISQNLPDFPSINPERASKMQDQILSAIKEGDSVGAVIECKITGLPVGLGEPMFDGVESKLAKIMFSIPAVKGFEIGAGFSVADRKGSENNDQIIVSEGKIATETNNDGGVNGGITNGMPVIFKVAFKPTPSIAKPQKTVNMETLEEETLEIKGRHDPCVAIRAVPVVEAAAAIAILDMFL